MQAGDGDSLAVEQNAIESWLILLPAGSPLEMVISQPPVFVSGLGGAAPDSSVNPSKVM